MGHLVHSTSPTTAALVPATKSRFFPRASQAVDEPSRVLSMTKRFRGREGGNSLTLQTNPVLFGYRCAMAHYTKPQSPARLFCTRFLCAKNTEAQNRTRVYHRVDNDFRGSCMQPLSIDHRRDPLRPFIQRWSLIFRDAEEKVKRSAALHVVVVPASRRRRFPPLSSVRVFRDTGSLSGDSHV